MALIETSLHKKYQEDTWGLQEALREVISNGIDGEVRNQFEGRGEFTLEYKPRSKVLIAKNRGITVPAKALLLGTSESRGRDDTIGTFGEGLPMALLVMARLEVDVTIFNGDEKWTPTIHQSEQYGEPILAVRTRQLLKTRGGFEVHVGGISKEEYAETRRRFLSLDPSYKQESVVSPTTWDSTRILLQPEYKGRLYNKGVFVRSRPDLWFGYDLNMDLNRDRQLMDEHELKAKVGDMLSDAVRNSPDQFRPLVEQALYEEQDSMEANDAYSYLTYNEDFVQYMGDQFVLRYGNDAIPVCNMEEAREAEFVGKRGIVVSALMMRLVKSVAGTLAQFVKRRGEATQKIVQRTDLSETEWANIERALTLVKSVDDFGLNVRIVEFNDEKLLGTYREADSRIDIARKVLGNFSETLKTLVHEICHAQGGDGTHDHGEAQLDLMIKIISVQAEGEA
jgi:hypothetical protein